MTNPRAKRRLGQHFLTDPRILGRIADLGGTASTSEVTEALGSLGKWSIRSVPRDQNAEADRLVNEELDGK